MITFNTETIFIFIIIVFGFPILLGFCTKKNRWVQAKKKTVSKNEKEVVGKKEAKVKNAKNEDDTTEDVKFNINVKKEEKGDDFDDDEENPIVNLQLKKKPPVLKSSANQLVSNMESKNEIVSSAQESNIEKSAFKGNGEQAVLQPNEKMIGVSCYQFETKPAKPTGKKQPQKSPMNRKIAAANKVQRGRSVMVPPAADGGGGGAGAGAGGAGAGVGVGGSPAPAPKQKGAKQNEASKISIIEKPNAVSKLVKVDSTNKLGPVSNMEAINQATSKIAPPAPTGGKQGIIVADNTQESRADDVITVKKAL